MSVPSNLLDMNGLTEGCNLYGCQPCPKCRSEYRAPYKRKGVMVIECGECGHAEDAAIGDEDREYGWTP